MNPILLITGFATAMAVAVSLTPIVASMSSKFRLFDLPDKNGAERRIHKLPTPRLGGIGIVLGFLVPILFLYDKDVLVKVSSFSLFIFAMGLLDDLLSLSAKLRIIFQIIVVFLAIESLGLSINVINIQQGIHFELPYTGGLILSTFIVVGAINSLNMIDGLDGLAGGIAVIATLMLTYLYFASTGKVEVLILLSVPIIGSVLGFLRYNTYPASIFMGDSGSNWLGFMIGILLVLNLSSVEIFSDASSSKNPAPMLSAILCFAIPIFDTLLVIANRLRSGLNPMQSDKRHFHHTLLKIGLTQSQSVVFIYFLSICSAIAGLLPILFARYRLEWVPWFWSLILFTVIPVSLYINSNQVARLKQVKLKIISRWYLSKQANLIFFIWEKINKYCLFAILVLSPAVAGTFSIEIGYLAAISMAVMIVALATSQRNRSDFLESIATTCACLTLLIANNYESLRVGFSGKIYNVQEFYNGLFIFLAVSTFFFVISTLRRKYLILSPSDFLMTLVPLLILLLPSNLMSEYRLDIISLRSLVIFICYKSLEKRRRTSHRHLKIAIFCALFYVAMVAIFKFKVIY